MVADVFRVFHTADWHLGKTLHEQDRHEEHNRFLVLRPRANILTS